MDNFSQTTSSNETISQSGSKEKSLQDRSVALDFLRKKKELLESNPYVNLFCTNATVLQKWRIDGIEYMRSLLNHVYLKKECTEAVALCQRIVKLVYAKNEEISNDPLKYMSSVLNSKLQPVVEDPEEQIVLVDLCCGKGFSASMMSVLFPHARILMIDSDIHLNLDHLKLLTNITFVPFQIKIDEPTVKRTHINSESVNNLWMCSFTQDPSVAPAPLTKSQIKRQQRGKQLLSTKLVGNLSHLLQDVILPSISKQTSKKISVYLLGVHLCTQLSEACVEVYKQMSQVKAMILSPCCMIEHENNCHIFDMGKSVADDSSLCKYYCWILYLYQLIRGEATRSVRFSWENNTETVPNSKILMEVDRNVLSEKNVYILCTKEEA